MRIIMSLTQLIALLVILTGIAYGEQINPPPEAYTACEGKISGDVAQLASPRGGTVTGVCKELDGKLVLQPGSPKGIKSGGPPREAYTACEGKRAGEASHVVTTRGETVSGICKELDGKLVLQPDTPKGNKSSGPPREAYTACEGKRAGEASQLIGGPRGESVSGICKEFDGKLILQPDSP